MKSRYVRLGVLKNLPPDPELSNKLSQTKKLLRMYTDELETCIDGDMKRTVYPDGKCSYVECMQGHDRRSITRGITNDTSVICKHARKRYLQQCVKVLSINLPILERCQASCLSMATADIIRSLPSTYEGLPFEAFFPHRTTGQKSWKNSRFHQNPYRQEQRTHIATNGLKVRSKSEVIIANMLEYFSIPYRYEMEITLGSKSYYPDFTIKSPTNGALIYWEHCGMMKQREYRMKHIRKMEIYAQNNILPFDNLIVSYDNGDGNFDSKSVECTMKWLLIKLEIWEPK